MAIGIFDSGIGGLTVLVALKKALPNERFVYLGDTARLPYGSKSSMTIKRYLDQNIAFLLKEGVKAVVVACNSASTVLSMDSAHPVPVYGVIKPGAAAALAATKRGRIGVMGTRATVASEAYPNALRQLKSQLFILQQACPLLVPLVEEGWVRHAVTKTVLEEYLEVLVKSDLDTVILGCTHYPVLKDVIAEILGPQVQLIDSAEVIARQLQRDLDAGHLQTTSQTGHIDVFTTDAADAFTAVANRIIAPLEIDSWRVADL